MRILVPKSLLQNLLENKYFLSQIILLCFQVYMCVLCCIKMLMVMSIIRSCRWPSFIFALNFKCQVYFIYSLVYLFIMYIWYFVVEWMIICCMIFSLIKGFNLVVNM